MNFFGYQGIKVEFVQLQSGTTTIQAIVGGSIDMTTDASPSFAGAVAQGIDLQAIQNSAMMVTQFCVRKDWAQQHNVTVNSTLEQKLEAMKGAKIAITAPGASADRLARFMLRTYGKLDPDNDTKMLSLGGVSALPGALDAGQVQAFQVSPPTCGLTKEGMVLIQPMEVPAFRNYTFDILQGDRKWLEAHKDLARALATSLAMGNNFMLKYPEAALKLLQNEFPKVDPQVVAQAFNEVVKPQTPPDGKFDASMWESVNRVSIDSGTISKAIPTAEGTSWTNAYIGDASVR